VIYLDTVGFVTMGFFFLLLIIGFFFEWSKGSLDWMNIH
jgi:NADH:ubiquinone oxidoreductase subunit 3 (subunit A)